MSNGDDSGQFIDSPSQLGNKILAWKQRGFHVLSPAIQISTFAQGYGVNASLVLLDPNVNPEGGAGLDVYFDKTTMKGVGNNKDGTEQRAPSKIGLMKIAAAIGVSWVEPYGRVDPLTIQNLWIYCVTGVYLAYDGTPQVIKGEKEIDYRDGSAQIGEWSPAAQRELEARNRAVPQGGKLEYAVNGWSEKRVRQARTNGAERAETGALERAIRTLGVRHVYTIDELKRPFVALRVCPMVDMSDPEVRRQVVLGQLGGVAKLYAHVQAAPPPAPRATFESPALRNELPPAMIAPQVVTTPAEGQAVAALRTAAPPLDARAHAGDGEGAQRELSRAQATVASAPTVVKPPIDPDAPDAEREIPKGAVYVRKVDEREMKYGRTHAKAGQSFMKYYVTDSDGVVYETVFPRWGSIAKQAEAEGFPVFIQTVVKTFRGEQQQDITNIKQATFDDEGDLGADHEDEDPQAALMDVEGMKL